MAARMKSRFLTLFLLPALLCVATMWPMAVQAQECEVCTDVLTTVMERSKVLSVERGEPSTTQEIIKQSLENYCKEIVGKDDKKEKLAATNIINEVTRPLSFPKPPVKVCDDLRKKDSQICDLKYDKPIEWDSLDLEKMRVKQLKELLVKLKDSCKGCVEKADFIARIKELKPKAETKGEL